MTLHTALNINGGLVCIESELISEEYYEQFEQSELVDQIIQFRVKVAYCEKLLRHLIGDDQALAIRARSEARMLCYPERARLS